MHASSSLVLFIVYDNVSILCNCIFLMQWFIIILLLWSNCFVINILLNKNLMIYIMLFHYVNLFPHHNLQICRTAGAKFNIFVVVNKHNMVLCRSFFLLLIIMLAAVWWKFQVGRMPNCKRPLTKHWLIDYAIF